MATYAYHFAGYGRNDKGTFSVNGIGTLTFDGQGRLSGTQKATAINIPAVGLDKTMSHSEYALTGRLTFSGHQSAQAEVEFRKIVNGRPEDEIRQMGYYKLVYEGARSKPSRFWFITAHDASPAMTKTEAVRGEAHLVDDPSPASAKRKSKR